MTSTDAISYCNVLFIGNLLSAFLVVAVYRPKRIFPTMKSLTGRKWGAILVNTCLSNVLITNIGARMVVLLLQTDVVFIALTGRVFFGDKVSKAQWAGYLLIGIGSAVLAFWAGEGAVFSGALYCIAAAAMRALGNAVARGVLAKEDTLPAFLFLRNLIGAICFFVLALQMYGPTHFANAFSAGLWELMLVYAAVVVVLAQLSWYRAVAMLPARTVTFGWTLTPIVSLFVAYLALGEVPTSLQWISVAFIAVGLAITQLGRTPARPMSPPGVERTLSGAR